MDDELVAHYGGGSLLADIEAGVAALGKTTATVTEDDLGPVDEFHVGGRPATVELCSRLDLGPAVRVLDVGSGIGGTARCIATTSGCSVVGIDLSPTYVAVARALTGWVGLDDRVTFEVGSALELPFEEGSFDRATQLHVGMNIDDKAALFAEVARVLRPGGIFGIYDLLQHASGEPTFPLPWASEPDQSFLVDAGTYTAALESAGFDVEVRDRHRFALDFFEAQARRAASGDGPPPLGLHLVMGDQTRTKLGNLRQAVVDGIVGPYELVCTLS